MPSRAISDLCEELRPKAHEFLKTCNADPAFKRAGIYALITCTFRDGNEQNLLYAKGRTAPGNKITNAKAGQSPHNCTEGTQAASRAFDIALGYVGSSNLLWDAASPLWRRAAAIGEALGLENGGSWGDWPHFQLKNWKVKGTESPKASG